MTEDTSHAILAEFDLKQGNLELMLSSCKHLVQELLRVDKLQVHAISGRVKGRQSLSEKLLRPDKSYTNLADVTDLVGLRVITFFEDDVDKVAELIRREFKLLDDHCVDKRHGAEPDRFGYRSLHYVCELPDQRKKLTENRAFKDECFELQIRSILQHAWAEIEHDLGYKAATAIPHAVKRKLSRVAGLLEIADRDFREVRDETHEYKKFVEGELGRNITKDIDLDEVSFEAFVASSPLVKELNDFMQANFNVRIKQRLSSDKLVEELQFAGVTSISCLQAEVEKRLGFLKKYALEVFRRTDREDAMLLTAISIFHLAQILTFEKGGVDLLTQFYERFNIAKSDRRRESAESFAHRYTKINAQV